MFDPNFRTLAEMQLENAGRMTDGRLRAAAAAARLYRRLSFGAGARRAWARVTRRPCTLVAMDAVKRTAAIEGCFAAGLHTIPIRAIAGSENRANDFDTAFAPLRPECRDRWLGVAAALLRGETLPAIQVIQVGEIYFVRDGHHRVSAARALGQEYIEAEVTVWVLRPVMQPATAAASRLIAL